MGHRYDPRIVAQTGESFVGSHEHQGPCIQFVWPLKTPGSRSKPPRIPSLKTTILTFPHGSFSAAHTRASSRTGLSRLHGQDANRSSPPSLGISAAKPQCLLDLTSCAHAPIRSGRYREIGTVRRLYPTNPLSTSESLSNDTQKGSCDLFSQPRLLPPFSAGRRGGGSRFRSVQGLLIGRSVLRSAF